MKSTAVEPFYLPATCSFWLTLHTFKLWREWRRPKSYHSSHWTRFLNHSALAKWHGRSFCRPWSTWHDGEKVCICSMCPCVCRKMKARHCRFNPEPAAKCMGWDVFFFWCYCHINCCWVLLAVYSCCAFSFFSFSIFFPPSIKMQMWNPQISHLVLHCCRYNLFRKVLLIEALYNTSERPNVPFPDWKRMVQLCGYCSFAAIRKRTCTY